MKPMLATLVQDPFDSKDWIFEIKWDGYRALAHKSRKVRLSSRNEKSYNIRFPEIVQELEQLPGNFILDGEIIIVDKDGRSQFQLLQNFQKEKIGTPYYYIFDILSYNGKDLTSVALIDRKKILQTLLKKKPHKHLAFSPHIEGKGKAFFQKAKKKGLEGIIAKRKMSPYLCTRSREWLKIKSKKCQEVVIGGYTKPRGTRKNFGALLVGIYEKGAFVYVGHVGGGFNTTLLLEVYKQMQRHIAKKCPFKHEPKANAQVTWVKPKLVCEVAFAEWTKAGMMRQPIFKGMRTDKAAREIIRELPV